MRAQSFILDLMIALSLAMLIGLLVLNAGLQARPEPTTFKDVETLSGALFDPFPRDWNDTTVIIPGFVVDQRFNMTLFQRFQNLTNDQVKVLIGIENEYYINVSSNGTTIGLAGLDPSGASGTNSVINRFAAHNGTIATVQIIVWEWFN